MAYRKLRETEHRGGGHIDRWGNVTFAIGLSAILVAITYGIQPYHGHSMGWTDPWITGSIARGGLQFMLIIWLQGIWLPRHLYRYSQTPLWAGIFLLPLTDFWSPGQPRASL